MQIMLGEVPTQTSVLHLGRSLKQKSMLQNTFPSSEVTLTLFRLLSVNQSPLTFHSAEARQRDSMFHFYCMVPLWNGT